MIANAVDLPGSPRIERTPARLLFPDSDLGERPVTVGVPPLNPEDIQSALGHGRRTAEAFLKRGLIGGAVLELQGAVELAGPSLAGTIAPQNTQETLHA
jgi:hypothetical protein